VLVVAAIVAGVLTVAALRHPQGHSAGQANSSTLNSPSPSPSPTPSPSRTPTGSSTAVPAHTSASVTISPTASTSASVSTSRSVVAPAAALPLIVLSNTGSETPADTAASRFRASGWTVSTTGSFEGAILSTAAYYDPASDGSMAAALALQKQFPAIQRVKPRFEGLPNGPVIVVVTSDYS
jgi:hypothetical protein